MCCAPRTRVLLFWSSGAATPCNLIFKSSSHYCIISQMNIHSTRATSAVFFSLDFGRVDSAPVTRRLSFVRKGTDGCRTGTADGEKVSCMSKTGNREGRKSLKSIKHKHAGASLSFICRECTLIFGKICRGTSFPHHFLETLMLSSGSKCSIGHFNYNCVGRDILPAVHRFPHLLPPPPTAARHAPPQAPLHEHRGYHGKETK